MKKKICLIDDDEVYQFLCKKTIEKSNLVKNTPHPSDVSFAKEISDVTGYLIKPITTENFNAIMNVFQ